MVEIVYKICALDVDGVLSDYPKCWVDFINKGVLTGNFKVKYPVFKNLVEAKNLLPYSVYTMFKDSYRASNYKASLPTKDGAVQLTEILRNSGYKIVVITSRPFDDYPELRMVTKNWLDLNGFYYDDLIYSKRKHLDIIAQFPDLKFMVEDNRSFANKVAEFGYKVYLVNNEYNQGDVLNNVHRITTFDSIFCNEGFTITKN